MTEENFRYFIEFVFVKTLKQQKIEFPVILFLDNHSSHVSMLISELCVKLEVILICLYPNSTHLMQPLDTSVFHGLKSHWSNLLLEKRSHNGNFKVNMANFPGLFLELLKKHHNPVAVRNGFRACGIFEWNINNIDFAKLLSCKRQTNVPCKPVVALATCTSNLVTNNSNSDVMLDVPEHNNSLLTPLYADTREIAEALPIDFSTINFDLLPPNITCIDMLKHNEVLGPNVVGLTQHNRSSIMEVINLEDSLNAMCCDFNNASLYDLESQIDSELKTMEPWDVPQQLNDSLRSTFSNTRMNVSSTSEDELCEFNRESIQAYIDTHRNVEVCEIYNEICPMTYIPPPITFTGEPIFTQTLKDLIERSNNENGFSVIEPMEIKESSHQMSWNDKENRYRNHRDSMSSHLYSDFETIEDDIPLNMASQDETVNFGVLGNVASGSTTHIPSSHLEPIELDNFETVECDLNPHRSPSLQQDNVDKSFDYEDKTFKSKVLEILKEIYGDTIFSYFNNDDHEPIDIKEDIMMRTLKAFRPISVAADVLVLPPINKRLGTKQCPRQPFIVSSNEYRQFKSKADETKHQKMMKTQKDKTIKKAARLKLTKKKAEARAVAELALAKKRALERAQIQIDKAERKAALKLCKFMPEEEIIVHSVDESANLP